ncbi:hypothetical protein [Wenxinia saemankumensis]|uniref:Curlin associated repeat-containing protein n=1 Tax=Wenxinia saemankumensis TaxID=1447782 RepID=A0A1M6EU00_9RHOB|nr:hypothetical protein [Wenxinia saemankumensis]SHI88981.1 Curlin associated repeat-containing protein [Wenxinia saemankumensis]
MIRRLALLAALALPAAAPAEGTIRLDWTPSAEAAAFLRLGLALRDLREGAELDQSGEGNALALDQRGAGNRALLRQRGRDHSAELVQRGQDNTQILMQFGRGTSSTIRQAGRGRTGVRLLYGF